MPQAQPTNAAVPEKTACTGCEAVKAENRQHRQGMRPNVSCDIALLLQAVPPDKAEFSREKGLSQLPDRSARTKSVE